MAQNEENNIQSKLLEALRNDSKSALSIIYNLYAKKLIDYVSKATKSKLDAEEIVHDIFLTLWNNRKILKPDTNLLSYLLSIAYRRRIDYFRKAMNAPVFEDYQDFKDKIETQTSSSQDLEYSEFLNIFNTAISKLPPKFQSVIILSRINGLSNQEIAEKLNISKKTVSNCLYEGLPMLKKILTDLMNLQ